MYYPEGMKARVSPVQSIESHRILAPRDLNREPLGPQSRVVTTILPLQSIVGTTTNKCPALLTLICARWHSQWRRQPQKSGGSEPCFFAGEQ